MFHLSCLIRQNDKYFTKTKRLHQRKYSFILLFFRTSNQPTIKHQQPKTKDKVYVKGTLLIEQLHVNFAIKVTQ